jgi:hypothetical protein
VHGVTCSKNHLSSYRAQPMFRVTFWLQWLPLILIIRQSASVSDQCSELREEIDRVRKLSHRNDLLVAQCYVSGYYTVHVSSLWYSHMFPNVVWVVIILCMCRHCDILICSPVICEWLLYCASDVTVIQLCGPTLCEWLLYCTCVVTMIQIYVALCHLSGY